MKAKTAWEINDSMINPNENYYVFADEDPFGMYEYCFDFEWDEPSGNCGYKTEPTLTLAQVFFEGDPRLEIIPRYFPHLMLIKVTAQYQTEVAK